MEKRKPQIPAVIQKLMGRQKNPKTNTLRAIKTIPVICTILFLLLSHTCSYTLLQHHNDYWKFSSHSFFINEPLVRGMYISSVSLHHSISVKQWVVYPKRKLYWNRALEANKCLLSMLKIRLYSCQSVGYNVETAESDKKWSSLSTSLSKPLHQCLLDCLKQDHRN